MTLSALSCARCAHPIPREDWNRAEPSACPECGAQTHVSAFPAIRGGVQPPPLPAILAQDEASCFYHQQNRATCACDQCGRFVCSLCALQMDEGTLCPNCLESAVRKPQDQFFENRRVMYDSIALAAATWPALLISPVIIGAPVALYLTIRHWRSPRSLVGRSRIRFYLAALFAITEIVLIALVIVVSIVAGSRK